MFKETIHVMKLEMNIADEVMSSIFSHIDKGIPVHETILRSIGITEHTTNGDALKLLFPNIQIQDDEEYWKSTGLVFVKVADNESHCYRYDWWTAPYEGVIE